MNIREQTILITGGATGIGKYLVENLVDRAEKIVILDKNTEALEALISSYEKVDGYSCDLTDYDNLTAVIERIYEKSNINVVINNAGYIYSEPLVNLMSIENRKHNIQAWNRTIDTNLSTTFYVATCVVEKMVTSRTKGLLINISSISASGNIGQSAYSAAKAGINALTTTWSKELAMFGIRSAAIAPGFFETESAHKAVSEAQLEKWRQSIPLKRLGKVKEILSAVEFIIENDYFNGRILELDGGLRI